MNSATLTSRYTTQAESFPRVFKCDTLWRHEQPLLDYLRSHHGQRSLNSFGGSYGWSVRYRQVEDYEALHLTTLAEYIDAFREGSLQLPYLRHLSVNRQMRDLRAHIHHPAEFTPNWVDHPWLDRFSGPEIFLGQAGTGFGNFHQDHSSVHIGFVQLEGRKQFTLYRPEDGQYLYRKPGAQFPWQMRNSAITLERMRDLEAYPELRKATPITVTLNAGQALLLPADWWHTTRNLTDSVSYSIRIINASNVGAALMRHAEGLLRMPGKLADALG
ncbi:MAG: hypothetical protein HKN56_01395 [Gammaproteobacteria bacterium]|nr:cupin-like domain-containing protein [Gammaproteobacteria bacterium]NND53608.1 hypothetical protein [Gammaproteobacteria bacterium]